MINVFSQCVRMDLVDTCLASGHEHVCVFFPPHKQRCDNILQDGTKMQYAVLGEKCARCTANIEVEGKSLRKGQ